MIADAQVERLWSSLTRRSRGKGARPELRPDFTRNDLIRWLEAAAVSPGAWRCEYGAPGCSQKRFAIGAGEISLDHRTPVSKKCGGRTTLANLAICCKRCNTLKGALDERHFRALIAFVREWRADQQASLLSRLMQPPRAWAKASAAARKEDAGWE